MNLLDFSVFTSLLKMRGMGECLKNGISHPFWGSGGGKKDGEVSDNRDFPSLFQVKTAKKGCVMASFGQFHIPA